MTGQDTEASYTRKPCYRKDDRAMRRQKSTNRHTST